MPVSQPVPQPEPRAVPIPIPAPAAAPAPVAVPAPEPPKPAAEVPQPITEPVAKPQAAAGEETKKPTLPPKATEHLPPLKKSTIKKSPPRPVVKPDQADERGLGLEPLAAVATAAAPVKALEQKPAVEPEQHFVHGYITKDMIKKKKKQIVNAEKEVLDGEMKKAYPEKSPKSKAKEEEEKKKEEKRPPESQQEKKKRIADAVKAIIKSTQEEQQKLTDIRVSRSQRLLL